MGVFIKQIIDKTVFNRLILFLYFFQTQPFPFANHLHDFRIIERNPQFFSQTASNSATATAKFSGYGDYQRSRCHIAGLLWLSIQYRIFGQFLLEQKAFDRTGQNAAGNNQSQTDNGADGNRFPQNNGCQNQCHHRLNEERKGSISRTGQFNRLHKANITKSGNHHRGVNQWPDGVGINAGKNRAMGKEQNGQHTKRTNDEAETVHCTAAYLLNAQLTQCGIQGETDGRCQYDEQAHAPLFNNCHRIGYNTEADEGQNNGDNLLPCQCIMRNKVAENHGKYRITGEDNGCQPCIGFINPYLEQHHAEHNVDYPQNGHINPI